MNFIQRSISFCSLSSQSEISLPNTTVPLEIVVTKLVSEEVPISNIVANISDTGAHVSVSVVQTSQGTHTPAYFEPITSTFVSLPRFLQHILTATTSPTFNQILQQPITTLLQSQSTDPPKTNFDDETVRGGFRGTYDELQFDMDEEDIPDHIIEVDVMLKAQEARLLNTFSTLLGASESRTLQKVDCNDKNNELRIKSISSVFNEEVRDLRRVAKERQVLFVLDVKKDYASLNQKMDIIIDGVTKFVKLNEALSPQISQLSADESKNFMEITMLLNELNVIISKAGSSPGSTLIILEFLSQKFLLFESVLHKQLAPLSRILNLLPSNAPLAVTGVQRGRKETSRR
ncbi:unnamed protein product [Lactuca saligna]|uniref:Uncharacterized protein n=1 Tax=Lactuca saligna TaxID=75948 RepID=A0AA35Z3A9_LACSI|nr:unnamed protein product [Lactuca saligna]